MGSNARRDNRVTFCIRTLRDASDLFKLASEAYSRLVTKLSPSNDDDSKSAEPTFAAHDFPSSRFSQIPEPQFFQDQQAEEVSAELFGYDYNGNTTAIDFTTPTRGLTTLPEASIVENPAPEADSDQYNLDMFSVLMQDDSTV